MKRLVVYGALLLPFAVLAFWAAYPQADTIVLVPLFHFYIVTFTTFAATVVSLFVTISVGETAVPRHLLLALAFAWMGAVFFVHGVTTPGAIIERFHPGIVWGAWLTLFGGGAIFLASTFTPNQPSRRFLRTSALAVLTVYAVFAAGIAFTPGTFSALQGLSISPAVAEIIFGITLGLWLLSGLRHYRIYARTHNFIDALMAFEAGWFAAATLSMFRFERYHWSWWLYHLLLLGGFLIASYALWRSYEQVRAFRLMRYFSATSLIVTAGLALLAAQAYTNFVFSNLREQVQRDTAFLTEHLANQLAASAPVVDSIENLRGQKLDPALPARVAELLQGSQAIQAVSLYDAIGMLIYTTVVVGPEQAAPRAMAPGDIEFYDAALGTTTFELVEPGGQPEGYIPSGPVHVLETYSPLWPWGEPQSGAPIGVMKTVRETPELTRATVTSRGIGLLLAALSLGGLFGALLFIVRRADRLINSRTGELERAYSDLRRAEGLRDDLTRMIVHDLRNPLTAMTTNLDLISRTLNNPGASAPDASPRFLTGARAAGKRMTGMIDDMLNISKMEAGELHPALAPVSLLGLLNEKLENYRPLAEKENITLEVDVPAELPPVAADPELIGRVIENLLSNAFKYTDRGGHIVISANRTGSRVNIQVCDDGQGIPPEYHQRIFEKFAQVTDDYGIPLRKGTGLGLAFCRLAVEAHGGQIRVESTLGQGSQFTFGLPVHGAA